MSRELIIAGIISTVLHTGVLCAFVWNPFGHEQPHFMVENARSAIQVSMTIVSAPASKSSQRKQQEETKDKKKPAPIVPHEQEELLAIAKDAEITQSTKPPKSKKTSKKPSNEHIDSTVSQVGNIRIGAKTEQDIIHPIVNVPPVYPRRSRERGEEGMVILEIEILSNGRVGEISVAKSSGYLALDRAAKAAVKKWRFDPARSNGVAMTVRRRAPIIFTLSGISS